MINFHQFDKPILVGIDDKKINFEILSYRLNHETLTKATTFYEI